MERRSDPARRPAHLHPRSIGLVLLGGTAGTAARAALSLVFPPVGGLPITTLAINAVGAFLLGALLESLTSSGGEARHRSARLLLGTGVLGGFTTYSALAADTALLLGGGASSGSAPDEFVLAGGGWGTAAILYAVGTVVTGVLAARGGIAVAAAGHRKRARSGA